MPPPFGYPGYDFLEEEESDHNAEEDRTYFGLSEMAMWYSAVLVAMLLLWLLMFFLLRIISLRQKTRSTQQRRQYMGSRARPSLPQTDPAIYVSPANLPPPPKYEAMAPPSYEEVVGIHYPNFQPQPITQPITTAMVQTQNTTTNTDNTESGTSGSQPTVLTVTNERAPTTTAVSS